MSAQSPLPPQNDPHYRSSLTEEQIREIYAIVKEKVGFYCISYNHPQRTQSMKDRFEKLDISLNVFEGVQMSDPRIANNETRQIPDHTRRLWSCTYGHLENIQQFYNDPTKEFGVFCENDVLVNKNLPFFLPQIMEEYKVMDLDFLLLGYMTTFKVEDWMQGYSLKHDFPGRPYKYLHYPEEQWGVHGYMLSKKGAKLLLDKYMNRADEYIGHPSGFNPDWILSKTGNRALITPMFIVENGEDGMEHYKDWGQFVFHRDTYLFNYVEGVFI